jgi:hypothetical protein
MRWLRRAGVPAIALAVCATAAGLADASGGPVRASAPDLHRIHWNGVTLPGAACDAPSPIHLHDGRALVTPVPARFAHDSFGAQHGLAVFAAGREGVTYGDLAGAGSEAAGVRVDCTNGGGSADGELMFSWVIFAAAGSRPSVLGIVTARVQPAHELPTLMTIAIAPGRITVHESFYGPGDPTCCSSGRATTIWTYAERALQPGTPAITHQASTSPMG